MLTRFWTFSLHIAGVVSLTLQPQQEIDLPANQTSDSIVNDPNPGNETNHPAVSILTPSNLASNQSDLGNAKYECDGSKYGQPPLGSCREAYHWIEYDQEILRYGDRTEPDDVDVLLPLRVSSSDGTCFIELSSTDPHGSDMWTPSQFKVSAIRIIQKCASADRNEGGSGRSLGQGGGLSMVVAQWTPHVECSKSRSVPEVMSSCLVALDRMPTSDHQEVFGARGRANIDVALPIKYTDRYGRCSIEVSLTGPPVRANWYGIWATAVTIVAMCVRSKREGVSVAGDSTIMVQVTCQKPMDTLEAAA